MTKQLANILYQLSFKGHAKDVKRSALVAIKKNMDRHGEPFVWCVMTNGGRYDIMTCEKGREFKSSNPDWSEAHIY